jgi:proline racemase
VQTLFVRTGEPVWGNVSADGTGVEVHGEKQPGDVDLVDVVAVQSFMQDADVHLDPEEELTTTLPVAAILRY